MIAKHYFPIHQIGVIIVEIDNFPYSKYSIYYQKYFMEYFFMTQTIRHYEGSHITINLLDIAKDFIKAYSLDREEYSISYHIDFDSYFSDYDFKSKPLFISKEWILIDSNTEIEHYENSANEMDERSVKIDCEDFTREKYLEIINQRITKGLESIGLEVTSIYTTDEITYLWLHWWGVNIESYRLYLQELLNSATDSKTILYSMEKIETYTLDSIRTISLERWKDIFLLGRKDFLKKDLFAIESIIWNPNIFLSSKDCIDLFKMYMETDILKLVLFILYLREDILDMSFNSSWVAEVVVDLEELKKQRGIKNPERILFNSENWDVFLDGKLIWTVAINTREFKFFQILYENIDADVRHVSILKHLEITKTENTANYLSDIKSRLPKTVSALIKANGGWYIIDTTKIRKG